MKSESIAFGIAGMAFGLIAGWIIGTQQAAAARGAGARAGRRRARAGERPQRARRDPRRNQGHGAQVGRRAASRRTRSRAIELGNLYFDAERYDDAIAWYQAALKITPNDVNLSTDLGVCYYYTNQPDKALAQLRTSLSIDPKHAKTLLNVGIVKAFGKQDLAGATKAWEQVVDLDPNSPEGQAAKRALDTLQIGSPGAGEPKPGALAVLGLRSSTSSSHCSSRGRSGGWFEGVHRRASRAGEAAGRAGRSVQACTMARDPVCGTYVVPECSVAGDRRTAAGVLLLDRVPR